MSTIYSGVDVVVDKKDQSVSKRIEITGTFESENIKTMSRFVKPGDVMMNIGCHIGLESMVMGQIIG